MFYRVAVAVEDVDFEAWIEADETILLPLGNRPCVASRFFVRPRRYARAIRLRLLEEQTREDAARLLEVTPATFDVLFHRAVGALKKHLGATAAGTDLGGATRP